MIPRRIVEILASFAFLALHPIARIRIKKARAKARRARLLDSHPNAQASGTQRHYLDVLAIDLGYPSGSAFMRELTAPDNPIFTARSVATAIQEAKKRLGRVNTESL